MGWPANPDDPDALKLHESIEEPYSSLGEQIETTGIVVDAEANEVQLEDDQTDTTIVVELNGQGADLEVIEDKQEVTFFGTIVSEQRIAVEPDRLVTRQPWERQYMYVISLVGALLTALLGINLLRINLRRLRFEPRTNPFIPILGKDR